VQATIKATFAQPVREVAVRVQEVTTPLKAAPKQIRGDQGRRHNLRRTHGRTGQIDKTVRFQNLITQAVNRDNTLLHGYPLHHSLSFGTQTVAER
jgi:hypothetical protein